MGEAVIRRFRAPLTLEGSAFYSDGEGSLIAYTTTALDNRRNENVTKLDAHGALNWWLGVKRVIRIGKNLPRAHRDMVERHVIACASLKNPGSG